MKRMALERKRSNSRSPSAKGPRREALAPARRKQEGRVAGRRVGSKHFVVCIRNDGYPASLELRKLYEAVDDAFAEQHHLIRVVDESGEDYLFPGDYFLRIELPRSVEQALQKIA